MIVTRPVLDPGLLLAFMFAYGLGLRLAISVAASWWRRHR